MSPKHPWKGEKSETVVLHTWSMEVDCLQIAVLPLLTFNIVLILSLNMWNTWDALVRHIYCTDMCAHDLWGSALQDENNDMKQDRERYLIKI